MRWYNFELFELGGKKYLLERPVKKQRMIDAVSVIFADSESAGSISLWIQIHDEGILLGDG